MNELEVRHDWQAACCMVTLRGEARLDTIDALDALAREVQQRTDARAMVVDMTLVEFMDSVSTGSLLRLHGLMDARGGKLVMHSLPPFVAKLFRRLGLDHFHLADDAASAVADAGRG